MLTPFVRNQGAPNVPAFFAGMDLDESGQIDPTEIKHFLKRPDPTAILGYGATELQLENQLDACFAALDINGDGQVELLVLYTILYYTILCYTMLLYYCYYYY